MKLSNSIIFIKVSGDFSSSVDESIHYLKSNFEFADNICKVIDVEKTIPAKISGSYENFHSEITKYTDSFSKELENCIDSVSSMDNKNMLSRKGYEAGNVIVILPSSIYDYDSCFIVPILNSILEVRNRRKFYNLIINMVLFSPDFLNKENQECDEKFARAYACLTELDFEFENKFKNYSDMCLFYLVTNSNSDGRIICPDFNIERINSLLREFSYFLLNGYFDIQPADLKIFKEKNKDKYTFLSSFGFSSLKFPRKLFYERINNFTSKELAAVILEDIKRKRFDNNLITNEVKYFLTGKEANFNEINNLLARESNNGEAIFSGIKYDLGTTNDCEEIIPEQLYSEFELKEANFKNQTYPLNIVNNLNTRKDEFTKDVLKNIEDTFIKFINADDKGITYARAFCSKCLGEESNYITGECTTEIYNLRNINNKLLAYYAEQPEFDFVKNQSLLNILKADIDNKERELKKSIEQKTEIGEKLSQEKETGNILSEADRTHFNEEIKSLEKYQTDTDKALKELKEKYKKLFDDTSAFERKYSMSSERQNLKNRRKSELENRVTEKIKPDAADIESKRKLKSAEIELKHEEGKKLLFKIILGAIVPALMIILGIILLPLFPPLIVAYIAIFISYSLYSLKKILKFQRELKKLEGELLDIKNRKYEKLSEYIKTKNSIYETDFRFLVNENAFSVMNSIENNFKDYGKKIAKFKDSMNDFKDENEKEYQNLKLRNDFFVTDIIQEEDLIRFFNKYVGRETLYSDYLLKSGKKLSDCFLQFVREENLNEFKNDINSYSNLKLESFNDKNLKTLILKEDLLQELKPEKRIEILSNNAAPYINIFDTGEKKPIIIGRFYAYEEEGYKPILNSIGTNIPPFEKIEDEDIIFIINTILGFAPYQVTVSGMCRKSFVELDEKDKLSVFTSNIYSKHSYFPANK